MKMKFFMLAAIILSSRVNAQQDTTKLLDDVVVTATKNAIKQSHTGKVVIVVNREELDRNSGKTLAEVLNSKAGLLVNGSSNVLGTNQDVYLRGAGTGKTLVLIDGIPVYDVAGISGAYDLNFISADQVERVEILKGSQSTLYGSDAVAGVINVISRKGSEKKIGFHANLSAGSYATVRGSVGIGGTIRKTNYNLEYTKTNSKGFSSAYDEAGNNDFDKDGFDADIASINIRQEVSKKLLINLHGQYNRYKADLDADRFADDADYTSTSENYGGGFGAGYRFGKNKLQLNYSYQTTGRTYLDDSASRSPLSFSYYSKGNYAGKMHFAELYSNIYLAEKFSLLLGTDYRHQSTSQEYFSLSNFGAYAAPSLGDTADVNQLGVYASLVAQDIKGFNLELGGRYNKFNRYGNVFTFSFSPSYVVAGHVKLFTNIASGFKTPSLYQVYSEFRNPYQELDPEHSLSFEAGVQYFKEDINVRAVYFARNVRDNIEFFSAGPPNYESYYVNASKQKDKGFELEASVRFGKLLLTGNYTNLDGYLQSRNDNKDTIIYNLYRRPRQTVNLNAGIEICPNWTLNIAVQSVGRRTEGVYAAAPLELPAYYVWNLYSGYNVTKNIRLYADLKNITDEKYFEVTGYNSRRFNFMAGAFIKF